jgi:hypothetical protein
MPTSIKIPMTYSETREGDRGFANARISLAILRATNLYIRVPESDRHIRIKIQPSEKNEICVPIK